MKGLKIYFWLNRLLKECVFIYAIKEIFSGLFINMIFFFLHNWQHERISDSLFPSPPKTLSSPFSHKTAKRCCRLICPCFKTVKGSTKVISKYNYSISYRFATVFSYRHWFAVVIQTLDNHLLQQIDFSLSSLSALRSTCTLFTAQH